MAGKISLDKDGNTLEIFEDKICVILNNFKIELSSVTVNQSGRSYVPIDAIELIE